MNFTKSNIDKTKKLESSMETTVTLSISFLILLYIYISLLVIYLSSPTASALI